MSVEELKQKIREIIDGYWAIPMEDPEDIDDLLNDRELAQDTIAKISLLVRD